MSRSPVPALIGRAAKRLLPLALCLVGWSPASGADYPVRAIRLVTAYTPGSPTDIVARTVSDHLAAELGQPVVVENRPGAGGITGTSVIAKSNPEGYTLLMANAASIIVGPAIAKKPALP